MELQETLLQEHSRAQTLKIVDFIKDDPQKFSELMELFLNGGYLLTQRAS
ncbi:hypothetical protein BH23BAC1_BH23BAC1_12360 [soil metagenome]